MAINIFESFCKLNDTHGRIGFDVIVEIVSRYIGGVNRYSVLIRKHEDEDFVFGKFSVEKGLIKGFSRNETVSLNMNFLEQTSMHRVFDGHYNFSGGTVDFFTIQFFSDSSQQKFLSEIRRIQKM